MVVENPVLFGVIELPGVLECIPEIGHLLPVLLHQAVDREYGLGDVLHLAVPDRQVQLGDEEVPAGHEDVVVDDLVERGHVLQCGVIIGSGRQGVEQSPVFIQEGVHRVDVLLLGGGTVEGGGLALLVQSDQQCVHRIDSFEQGLRELLGHRRSETEGGHEIPGIVPQTEHVLLVEIVGDPAHLRREKGLIHQERGPLETHGTVVGFGLGEDGLQRFGNPGLVGGHVIMVGLPIG